jgi:hypothetical protein
MLDEPGGGSAVDVIGAGLGGNWIFCCDGLDPVAVGVGVEPKFGAAPKAGLLVTGAGVEPIVVGVVCEIPEPDEGKPGVAIVGRGFGAAGEFWLGADVKTGRPGVGGGMDPGITVGVDPAVPKPGEKVGPGMEK